MKNRPGHFSLSVHNTVYEFNETHTVVYAIKALVASASLCLDFAWKYVIAVFTIFPLFPSDDEQQALRQGPIVPAHM